MISLPTRLLCAVFSMIGAAGLVAVSAPAVAGQHPAGSTAAPATTVASVAAPAVRHA